MFVLQYIKYLEFFYWTGNAIRESANFFIQENCSIEGKHVRKAKSDIYILPIYFLQLMKISAISNNLMHFVNNKYHIINNIGMSTNIYNLLMNDDNQHILLYI